MKDTILMISDWKLKVGLYAVVAKLTAVEPKFTTAFEPNSSKHGPHTYNIMEHGKYKHSKVPKGVKMLINTAN